MLYQYVGYNGSRVRARGETYPRGPGAIKPIIEHSSVSESDFYFEFQECRRRLCGHCTQCRLTSEELCSYFSLKQFESTWSSSSSKLEGEDALPPKVEGSSAPTAGGVLAEVSLVVPTVSG